MNTVREHWEKLHTDLANPGVEVYERDNELLKLGFYCGVIAMVALIKDNAEVSKDTELALGTWLTECVNEMQEGE